MIDSQNTVSDSLPLSSEATALLEQVKMSLASEPMTDDEFAAAEGALARFTATEITDSGAQGEYRDTAYQDRYQDTAYRDSSTYADTPSYRDAAKDE